MFHRMQQTVIVLSIVLQIVLKMEVKMRTTLVKVRYSLHLHPGKTVEIEMEMGKDHLNQSLLNKINLEVGRKTSVVQNLPDQNQVHQEETLFLLKEESHLEELKFLRKIKRDLGKHLLALVHL